MECEFAVETAIKAGYRLIDTANTYRNEGQVGNALKKCIDEGVVKREDMFITTKLWVTTWRAEDVAKAISISLERLQTDYIDLLLVHEPAFINLTEEGERRRREGDFLDVDMVVPNDPKYRLGYNLDCLKEMWGAMEKAVREGKVRSIGVANFSSKKVNDVLSFCTIPPAMDQVEMHPYLQQWEVKEALEKHGIKMTAFYPLGGSANQNNDGTGGNESIEFGFLANHNKGKIALLKNPQILAIAKNHNKTPAQILLRWAVQRGTVCIPKSVHENRIKENFDIFDFELTDEEMKEIRSMDMRKRYSDVSDTLFPGESNSRDYWDNEYLYNCLLIDGFPK